MARSTSHGARVKQLWKMESYGTIDERVGARRRAKSRAQNLFMMCTMEWAPVGRPRRRRARNARMPFTDGRPRTLRLMY